MALLLQSTLGGISLDAGTRVNFVLVAVIYCALSFGAMTGLLAQRIREAVGVDVRIAPAPLRSVAAGLARFLERGHAPG